MDRPARLLSARALDGDRLARGLEIPMTRLDLPRTATTRSVTGEYP